MALRETPDYIELINPCAPWGAKGHCCTKVIFYVSTLRTLVHCYSLLVGDFFHVGIT